MPPEAGVAYQPRIQSQSVSTSFVSILLGSSSDLRFDVRAEIGVSRFWRLLDVKSSLVPMASASRSRSIFFKRCM